MVQQESVGFHDCIHQKTTPQQKIRPSFIPSPYSAFDGLDEFEEMEEYDEECPPEDIFEEARRLQYRQSRDIDHG